MADIVAETRGALGLVTLTRPQALNALNDEMVDGLQAALIAFRDDPAITRVAIRGAGGKAFCAGGDIRLMHEYGQTGRHAVALDFWAREYRLNAFIKRFPKPYIALVDGIVMGGGVGVSLHGSHRFAGPNYLFAMPEVGIGFFPDVGATYALPRLPGAFGMYLALTGARLKRGDAMALGLATHALRGGVEEEILAALASGEDVEAVAARFAEPAGETPVFDRAAEINRLFAGTDLGTILARLHEAAKDSPFAAELVAGMAKRSPTSMAIALEQIRRGASLDFEAAMVLEFRIVSRIVHGHDFYEGVRALIIDKDNRPQWQPATPDGLDPAMIANHFAPLDADLTFSQG